MRIFSPKTALVVVSGVAFAILLQISYWFLPLTPPSRVTLDISNGMSLSQVARDLERKGVIRSATPLKLLARLRQQSGAIHSGTYLFSDPANPAEILARLVSGDVVQTSVTIPEGFNLQQIAERLDALGLANGESFLQLAQSPELLDSLGIQATSLEGYLFPETYHFVPGTGEAELLRMMVNQLFSRLDPAILFAAEERGLDRHQLLTLASIIEKETGQTDEMPLIASVFHNRLRLGIPLQTDPTVIYGIPDFDGNLTRKHLTTPTPYNTYKIRGLPPGPIASPGLEALKAAAQPADTDFLYFVSRGDGRHVFSKTLREHNQAVRRYQLRRLN